MHIILVPLLNIAIIILDLYIWVLVISVVVSWLIVFNVVNKHNRFTYLMGDFLYRVTEPALRRTRRMIPVMGEVDFSPMILILILVFLKMVLQQIIQRVAVMPGW